MCNSPKREIIEKIRLIFGLMRILKDNIDDLRAHADSYDFTKMNDDIDDTKETLQTLTDTVAEIEYILYLEKNE